MADHGTDQAGTTSLPRLALLCVVVIALGGLAFSPAPVVPDDAPVVAGGDDEAATGYIQVESGAEMHYTLKTPRGPGPFPTVFTYDPYYAGTSLRAPFVGQWDFLLGHGYAVIGVTLGGAGCSTGEYTGPDAATWGRDGAEVVEWIADQSWSDGHVGMAGASFPGLSQLGVAGFDPPHLDAIAPWDATADWYRDIFYPGGIRNLTWPEEFGRAVQPSFAAAGMVETVASGQECKGLTAGELADRTVDNFARQARAHPFDDEYWQAAPIARVDQIDVPVLGCQSWHDSAVGSRTSELYTGYGLDPRTTWFLGTNGQHGVCLPADEQLVRFMDRYVKGERNGWERTPHVQIGHDVAVGEANPPYERPEPGPEARWFSEPQRVTPASLQLHADGSMDQTVRATQAVGSYRYPLPSSSAGLPFAAEPGEASGWVVHNAPGGSLSYTTPPLTHDVEVLGPASADLWVSSTATDADLQVTVTEVRPDGHEQYLQRGWLRLSHRALDRDRSTELRPYHPHGQDDLQPVEPGEPVLARIEVKPFGHVFREGSSIRLTLEAPTGATHGHLYDYLETPAINTVHTGGATPSSLTLGVVPSGIAERPPSTCNTVNMEPCRPDIGEVPDGSLTLHPGEGH